MHKSRLIDCQPCRSGRWIWTATSNVRPELGFTEARDILWSLTCRELYRLLVSERKWTADHYERWLGTLLPTALLKNDLVTRQRLRRR